MTVVIIKYFLFGSCVKQTGLVFNVLDGLLTQFALRLLTLKMNLSQYLVIEPYTDMNGFRKDGCLVCAILNIQGAFTTA